MKYLKNLPNPEKLRILKSMDFSKMDFKDLVYIRQDILLLKEFKEIEKSIRETLSVEKLDLERITENHSIKVFEKLIKYENVHKMNNLQELYKRLRDGRRIYGLFHGNWKHEPLCFVEIALMTQIATSISNIFENHSQNPTTANLYSINSTQPGLSGIDVGNLMIKGVIKELSSEFNSLRVCTLSPIVGFCQWLRSRGCQKDITHVK